MRGAALIVLAWNRWTLTRRCLDSLLASRPAEADLIVVDNGSHDETPAGLAEYAGRVRVITLPENLGFVRGMNAGIAAARPDDDVVLLNNDLLFNQSDWLDRLRDAAYAAPENGIVGCRLLGPEPEGRVYHVGGFIEADELHGEQTESGIIEREVGQYPYRRRVQAVAFALAYLRRDCIDRIGTLDEAFHSYFEDTDYCLRGADAGIASIVAGAVTLQHDQHGSTEGDSGFRQRLFAQSRETFAARWHDRLRAQWRGEVGWHGPTRFPHAQAELAHALVRRLDARGLRMRRTASASEAGGSEDHRLDLAARRRGAAWPEAAIACGIGSFAQARGRYRIGLAFGEWERVPTAWAEATRSLDRLLVADEFQRAAFLAAGVHVPVDVLPIGVDRDYCHANVPAPRHPDGAFVFLAIAEDVARDAPDRLATAFQNAFAADDGAELLIHIRPGTDAAAIRAALAPALADRRRGRVRVIDDWGLPRHQRAQLLCAADAYVSARRGGGWDPSVAEALACGRILIAPDFGSTSVLVRAHGLPVALAGLVDDPAQPGCRWAEADLDALAAQMQAAFAQRTRLATDAQANAEAFARAHDIEHSADALVEILAEGGTLAAAPTPLRAHHPADLKQAASGQIVVLGMHRSGTSAVAGLLARMGIHAGAEHDRLIGADNPKGHYELAALHAACLRRLEAAGGDWNQPPTHAPGAAVDAFRRDAAAVLEPLDAERPWLIKEPRLCLVARELLPLLTRPVFVHVVRHPDAVAASLATRDGIAPADAFALWEHYNRAAFEASRGWPRLLVVYEELVADPVATAHALHRQLAELGVPGLQMPDESVVRAWIDAELSHAPEAPSGTTGDSVSALWEAMRTRRILDDDRTSLVTDAAAADRHAG